MAHQTFQVRSFHFGEATSRGRAAPWKVCPGEASARSVGARGPTSLTFCQRRLGCKGCLDGSGVVLDPLRRAPWRATPLWRSANQLFATPLPATPSTLIHQSFPCCGESRIPRSVPPITSQTNENRSLLTPITSQRQDSEPRPLSGSFGSLSFILRCAFC